MPLCKPINVHATDAPPEGNMYGRACQERHVSGRTETIALALLQPIDPSHASSGLTEWPAGPLSTRG